MRGDQASLRFYTNPVFWKKLEINSCTGKKRTPLSRFDLVHQLYLYTLSTSLLS